MESGGSWRTFLRANHQEIIFYFLLVAVFLLQSILYNLTNNTFLIMQLIGEMWLPQHCGSPTSTAIPHRELLRLRKFTALNSTIRPTSRPARQARRHVAPQPLPEPLQEILLLAIPQCQNHRKIQTLRATTMPPRTLPPPIPPLLPPKVPRARPQLRLRPRPPRKNGARRQTARPRPNRPRHNPHNRVRARMLAGQAVRLEDGPDSAV